MRELRNSYLLLFVLVTFIQICYVQNQSQSGIITLNLTNVHNVAYLANITVNNNAFNLLLCTGYGWIWVSSSNVSMEMHNDSFNCTLNSSCINTEIPEIVSYPAAYLVLNGTFVVDSISIGDATLYPGLILWVQQAFNISNFTGDGFIGIGLKGSSDGIPTILDRLYEQKLINASKFSMDLTDNPAGTDQNSVLTLGGDNSKYNDSNSNITYVPLVSEKFIYIDIFGISLGNQTISNTNNTAWIVASVPFISIPESDVDAVVGTLGPNCNWINQGSYSLLSCDCTDTSSFGNFSFNLGSVNVTLSVNKYVMFDATNQICNTWLAKLEFPLTVWIFGSAFIREYYTIVDYQNMQVGLAQKS